VYLFVYVCMCVQVCECFKWCLYICIWIALWWIFFSIVKHLGPYSLGAVYVYHCYYGRYNIMSSWQKLLLWHQETTGKIVVVTLRTHDRNYGYGSKSSQQDHHDMAGLYDIRSWMQEWYYIRSNDGGHRTCLSVRGPNWAYVDLKGRDSSVGRASDWKPGTIPMLVWVPSVAREFSPRVNFQCRLS